MFFGATLFSSSDTGLVYYSPWVPKQGNSATFVCDMIASAAVETDGFTISVQTKANEEDDSAAVTLGSAQAIDITPDTRTPFERGLGIDDAGFKDLVRLKYSLTFNGSGLSFVHFQILEPSWLSD